MPTLKLVRDSGWADKLRAYKILLNGTEVCKINDGEELSFPIEPGQYAIKAKIDWCGSREVRFDVADQDVVFDVESSMRGPALFGALFMLFNPNGWILLTLRSTPGNKAKERESVVSKSNVGGKSKAEELRDAKSLLDDGIIDDAEFKQMKKEILGK